MFCEGMGRARKESDVCRSSILEKGFTHPVLAIQSCIRLVLEIQLGQGQWQALCTGRIVDVAMIDVRSVCSGEGSLLGAR